MLVSMLTGILVMLCVGMAVIASSVIVMACCYLAGNAMHDMFITQ